ncbi:UNKNOWN [Stylonychia lemnae]|uniref:Uncharacterized protein n=1 Tax=Stylonychia lemnae TaxID=5949 RepID=A0A078APL1_STYLE|nr:UNKNOWN [Stylonychia lemnae]|eukprot:CDW84084.1 UNKNOWN [Stylonychia lemnae]
MNFQYPNLSTLNFQNQPYQQIHLNTNSQVNTLSLSSGHQSVQVQPIFYQNFNFNNKSILPAQATQQISAPIIISQPSPYLKIGAYQQTQAQQFQQIPLQNQQMQQTNIYCPMIIQRNQDLVPRYEIKQQNTDLLSCSLGLPYNVLASSSISQNFGLQSLQSRPAILVTQNINDLSQNCISESDFQKNDQNSVISDGDDFLRPLKFKLHSLSNKNLRYEVIYKNLLRDLRKFYLEDFNECTEYFKKKRRCDNSFLMECLKMYVAQKNIINCEPFPGKLIGTSEEKLIFCLGSLLYPKEMIKCYIPDFQDDDLKDIKTDFKDKPLKARKVIGIYHYLYRFSLNRLNRFINDPSLVKICWYYFNQAGQRRIERSNTMKKYRDAYYEAMDKLKNYDHFANILRQGQRGNFTGENHELISQQLQIKKQDLLDQGSQFQSLVNTISKR